MGTVRENTVVIGGVTYDLRGDPERMPAGLLRLGRKALKLAKAETMTGPDLVDAFGFCEDALRYFLGPEQYEQALPALDTLPVIEYMGLVDDLFQGHVPETESPHESA